MPKFEVEYVQSEIYRVVIEAPTKDEAEFIVSDMVDDGSIKEYHVDSEGEFTTQEVRNV